MTGATRNTKGAACAGEGLLHMWVKVRMFAWALCCVCPIHSSCQSVSQRATRSERFSTAVKHAESDLSNPPPALLKFQVFEKGKASQMSMSTGEA